MAKVGRRESGESGEKAILYEEQQGDTGTAKMEGLGGIPKHYLVLGALGFLIYQSGSLWPMLYMALFMFVFIIGQLIWNQESMLYDLFSTRTFLISCFCLGSLSCRGRYLQLAIGSRRR